MVGFYSFLSSCPFHSHHDLPYCRNALLLLADNHTKDKTIKRVVRCVERMAKKCIELGVQVTVIPPGPRMDVEEDRRQELVQRVSTKMGKIGVNVACMENPGESRADFLKCAVEQYHKVHVSFDRFKELLLGILSMSHMESDGIDAKVGLDRATLFRGLCWNCGSKNHMKRDCAHRPNKCSRCNGDNHFSETCIYIHRMCTTCGSRGHSRAVCSAKRSRHD